MKSTHKLANELKFLCAFANKIIEKKLILKLNNWQVIKIKKNQKTNFKAVLFLKNKKYALCFVGTDFACFQDHKTNIKMALSGKTAQMLNALDFTTNLISIYKLNYENLILFGHSEGGTEATFVAVKLNFNAVTFNSYGINRRLINKNFDYTKLITNYRMKNDPISSLKPNIGKTYTIKHPFCRFSLKAKLKAHRIEDFGDCTKAIISFPQK